MILSQRRYINNRRFKPVE